MFDGPIPVAATLSKDPKMFAQGFTPTALVRGEGAHVMASDGRQFLDWISALGANLLGYGHEHWQAAVTAQVMQGAGFSLPHVLERQVAEKFVAVLGRHVPGWTPDGLGVRFGLSGTDATTMAVRLARAVRGTGDGRSPRQKIVSIGYHGWASEFISLTAPAWGIPDVSSYEAQSVPFGDIDFLTQLLSNGDVACVIVEQLPQDPPPCYWQTVRRLCTKYGALLTIDEVVTWPRYSMGGACEYYGIVPDIICLGKSLGNGIPISAIVGRREYFEWFARTDPCFVSSTHFGNAVSLAAASAVLDVWDEDCIRHIWWIGEQLIAGLHRLGYQTIGNAPRFLIQFPTLAHKTYFVLGMRDRGILWNRPTFPNLAHTEADVIKTLTAAAEIKAEMANIDVEAEMRDRLPMVLFENR